MKSPIDWQFGAGLPLLAGIFFHAGRSIGNRPRAATQVTGEDTHKTAQRVDLDQEKFKECRFPSMKSSAGGSSAQATLLTPPCSRFITRSVIDTPFVVKIPGSHE
jgi:hypothetical protein